MFHAKMTLIKHGVLLQIVEARSDFIVWQIKKTKRMPRVTHSKTTNVKYCLTICLFILHTSS
jgi:uncharacterized membrane protein